MERRRSPNVHAGVNVSRSAARWIGVFLAMLPAGRALAVELRAESIPAAAARDEERGFQVVVNAGCEARSISRAELSRLFLKKSLRWACGDSVAVVDQAEGSELRARFTWAIHHKSLKALKAYWRREIFSGQDVPPPEKASDAEVLDFVRGNPSAIGYVSKRAPTAAVRVLEVTQ